MVISFLRAFFPAGKPSISVPFLSTKTSAEAPPAGRRARIARAAARAPFMAASYPANRGMLGPMRAWGVLVGFLVAAAAAACSESGPAPSPGDGPGVGLPPGARQVPG